MVLGGGEGFFWGDDGVGWVEGSWIEADTALWVDCFDDWDVAEVLGLIDEFGEDEEVEDEDN